MCAALNKRVEDLQVTGTNTIWHLEEKLIAD